jgi:hypothetical protein
MVPFHWGYVIWHKARLSCTAVRRSDLLLVLQDGNGEDIVENIDAPLIISALERELANCGLQTMDHIVTPLDLANLRQNFLAKNKRKVFDSVRSVMELSTKFGDGMRV